MSWKQNCIVLVMKEERFHMKLTKCDITDFVISTISQSSHILKFQRRLIPKEYLRSVLYCSSSGIYEFLENGESSPAKTWFFVLT